MANKIKYGIEKCYYAPITAVSAAGVPTYATPVPLLGAVNLNMAQEGESNPFYADNIVYFQMPSNSGYSGTLELALIPDDFRKDVLGEREDDNGLLVEFADALPKEFALLFQFEGDESATRHVFYRCSCSRPDVASQTKEASIDPVTETINITAMARIDNKLVKAKCPESATAKYNAWYTAVTEPSFT